MVVGDDHVDADLRGVRSLLDGGDAAVDRYDKAYALRLERVERGAVEPVALLVPVGDIGHTLDPLAAQIVRDKAGGGDAVHIIVAVDCDGLPVPYRAQDALVRLVHVQHQHGVAQQLLPAGDKRLCFGGGFDPPQRQHHRQQRREAR